MLDYSIGLKSSFVISLIFAIPLWMNFMYPFFKLIIPKYLFLTFYLPIIFGLSVFTIIYPLINTISQFDFFYNNFLNNEFNWTEFIIIRLTSIYIGYRTFVSVIGVFKNWFKLGIYSKVEDLNEMKVPIETVEFDFKSEWSNLSQVSIYIITAFILQFVFIENNNFSVLAALTNTVLFFIMDDWNIIHDYTTEYKKNIIKSHKLKINILNIVIVILAIGTTFYHLKWEISIAFVLIIMSSLYWRYIVDLKKIIDLTAFYGNNYSDKELNKKKKFSFIFPEYKNNE